jgi:hypothetical protein
MLFPPCRHNPRWTVCKVYFLSWPWLCTWSSTSPNDENYTNTTPKAALSKYHKEKIARTLKISTKGAMSPSLPSKIIINKLVILLL